MSTLTEQYRVLVAEKIAETGVDMLRENFDRMRSEAAGHEIEDIGGDLRSMMPWIDQGFKDTK